MERCVRALGQNQHGLLLWCRSDHELCPTVIQLWKCCKQLMPDLEECSSCIIKIWSSKTAHTANYRFGSFAQHHRSQVFMSHSSKLPVCPTNCAIFNLFTKFVRLRHADRFFDIWSSHKQANIIGSLNITCLNYRDASRRPSTTCLNPGFIHCHCPVSCHISSQPLHNTLLHTECWWWFHGGKQTV